MWLFKLSNIFNFIIKIHKNFQIVFTEFQNISFMKDLALLVLHDCIVFYNVMSKELRAFVENYFLLATIDAV